MSSRNTGKLQAAAAAAQTPAAATPAATIYDLLERNKAQIGRALPSNLDADRFARLVFTQCRTTPKLLQCSGTSLLAAAMYFAQLGLEPGPLGHAWMTPRRIKGVWQVLPIIGYRGYIELARRSGAIRTIVARTVHQGDVFDYAYGLEERLEHRPSLAERGPAVAYYGVAHFTEGGHQIEVMSPADIATRRARAGAKDDGPWATDFDAMARKTVSRAMAPYLPLSVEAQAAIATDEHVRTELGPNMLDLPAEPVADEEPNLEVVDVDPTEPAPADPPADTEPAPPQEPAP